MQSFIKTQVSVISELSTGIQMSRSTITLSLKHHINDLTDILSDIQHNRLEGDESVWYEFWDAVLNYWIAAFVDSQTRLPVAPQKRVTREIIKADFDHCMFYSATVRLLTGG
jgi:hypothetical protein